jgi:hypothetical protein
VNALSVACPGAIAPGVRTPLAVVEHGGELSDRRVVADDREGSHVAGGLPDGLQEGLDGVVVDPLVDDRLRGRFQRRTRPLPGLCRPTRGGHDHAVGHHPGLLEPRPYRCCLPFTAPGQGAVGIDPAVRGFGVADQEESS